MVSILGAGKNGQLLYGMFSTLGVKIDAVYDDHSEGSLGFHNLRNLGTMNGRRIPLVISISPDNKNYADVMSRVTLSGIKYWQAS